ncbi:hybrid sensor histidine kinase/response regulator [Phenylobacterium montanum]|uniref:histidine kinase n=1 Tax=Phenylobacterium montanum TaxID=2823693 RepID=A0A975FXT3_9CAUL|nr:ATP-binding protein [Caulobacter sp. S6]QUD87265.1 response regulator [Caulobacter sp. S6]
MLLKKITATSVVVLSIVIVALAVSYVVDVYLFHTPEQFAPVHTTVVALLVGSPVSFIIISQRFDATLAREKLAESVAAKDWAAAEAQARRHEAEAARVAAEAALKQARESEARYRMLAEKATDIIVRYDADGMVEYVSPSIRLFGFRPEEIVGRHANEFVHPEDEAGVRERRQQLVSDRPVTAQRRARIRTASGGWAWVEGSPSPIRDEGGKIVGAVTVLRDVTAAKVMEDELVRQRIAADASNVAKAEFVANMSHEIRTPLTGVIGFAGLLERMDDLPERARRYVDRIIMGGQALLAIVNDVLDFSRLDAGQIELDPQPFQLDSFLKDSVDLVAADARAKGLELTTERKSPLPATVFADSGRVRQVLLNLLSNAIKFTTEGSVTLTVAYEPEEGGRLRFTVADTGPGISAEHASRLFQRFSQIDASNTREHGGAGLGLAISKGLTEMMGGDIGVESGEGRGSTFWFTVAAPAVQLETVAGEAPQVLDIPPMRVLIVDDVAANRELVSHMLAPYDLQLTEAENGLEAVEAALNTPFDVILMDLQMPGMDGLAATRAIRANSEMNKQTPILAVSANVLPAHVEACRQAGMNDHIGKPINPRELIGKIDRWTAAAA